MNPLDICVGDSLFFIDKSSGNVETVYVLFSDDASLSVTYMGEVYNVPLLAIGTLFFDDPAAAWLRHQQKMESLQATSIPEENEALTSHDNEKTPTTAMHDVHRTCAECGREFVWTADEQRFYKKKGLAPPITCSKECRERRRNERKREDELRDMRQSMQRSVPFRTGSNAKNTVHVSGSVVAPIDDGLIPFLEENDCLY